jgi:hypothetical protein
MNRVTHSLRRRHLPVSGKCEGNGGRAEMVGSQGMRIRLFRGELRQSS